MAEFRASPLFTEGERAALELAEAVSSGPVDVPDELFERLRASYDDPQLVELAATCALENFRARFSRVFRIDPNHLYCPIPTAQEGQDSL